jgi:hypothetical protein
LSFWTCWDLWSLLLQVVESSWLVDGLYLCMYVCLQLTSWSSSKKKHNTRRYISNEKI